LRHGGPHATSLTSCSPRNDTHLCSHGFLVVDAHQATLVSAASGSDRRRCLCRTIVVDGSTSVDRHALKSFVVCKNSTHPRRCWPRPLPQLGRKDGTVPPSPLKLPDATSAISIAVTVAPTESVVIAYFVRVLCQGKKRPALRARSNDRPVRVERDGYDCLVHSVRGKKPCDWRFSGCPHTSRAHGPAFDGLSSGCSTRSINGGGHVASMWRCWPLYPCHS